MQRCCSMSFEQVEGYNQIRFILDDDVSQWCDEGEEVRRTNANSMTPQLSGETGSGLYLMPHDSLGSSGGGSTAYLLLVLLQCFRANKGREQHTALAH